MFRRSWIALATILMASQIGTSQARAQAIDTAGILAANTAYYTALSSRDMAAIGHIFAREGVFNIFAAARAPQQGWDAVRVGYEELFKRFPELNVVLPNPAVVQHNDVALVVGVETLRAKTNNGDPVELSLPTTNVYVRRDGRWLMIHHHTSRPPS